MREWGRGRRCLATLGLRSTTLKHLSATSRSHQCTRKSSALRKVRPSLLTDKELMLYAWAFSNNARGVAVGNAAPPRTAVGNRSDDDDGWLPAFRSRSQELTARGRKGVRWLTFQSFTVLSATPPPKNDGQGGKPKGRKKKGREIRSTDEAHGGAPRACRGWRTVGGEQDHAVLDRRRKLYPVDFFVDGQGLQEVKAWLVALELKVRLPHGRHRAGAPPRCLVHREGRNKKKGQQCFFIVRTRCGRIVPRRVPAPPRRSPGRCLSLPVRGCWWCPVPEKIKRPVRLGRPLPGNPRSGQIPLPSACPRRWSTSPPRTIAPAT